MTRPYCISLLAALPLAFAAAEEARKPTLFLIGDSTVKNTHPPQQGWGSELGAFLKEDKIALENRALGGRSSRSYLREGLWKKVAAEIKPGDFVVMQFGHNDNGPLDAEKARASIKGNGEEAKEVTIKESGAKETVHSFGWYMRKYISETKAKGATAIVCSLVPRDIWKDGKVTRSVDTGHGLWAKQAAEQAGAHFINLNGAVCDRYETLGQAKVHADFFPGDHTHTNAAGAKLNAECVAEGLKKLPNGPLAAFLK
jgi:lysophospholipase L1-like esterase